MGGCATSMLSQEDPFTPSMVQIDLPPLLDALNRDDCPELQLRALGMHQTEAVLHSGAIPVLISFLSREGDLAERSILALGNFVLLGAEARGLVLRLGAVPAMLPHLRPGTSVRRLRTFVRAYSSLCSYHDDTSFVLTSPALPYLCELLDIKDEEPPENEDTASPRQPPHKEHTASDVVEAVCTALINLTYGSNEHIEEVQCVPGLTERLVQLLGHEAANVQEAALSAVGNMLAGTDAQVDRCLEAGCLQHVASLLRSSNPSLVQEAARAAANVLAGTHAHIHRALEAGVLTALQDTLADDNQESRQQAAYAVTFLCLRGTSAQRDQLTASGVLKPYCELLAQPACSAAEQVLDGLDALLKAAELDGNVKPLCYMLDECDVLDQIQQLQRVTNEDSGYKIANISVTLRKYAREERHVVLDGQEFTVDTIVRELESQQQTTQTRAAHAVSCMLREQNPPINALLEAGIMAALVVGLDKDACPDLQHMAVWVLSKITTGTRKHRIAVAHSGVLLKLMAFLVRGDEVAVLAACSLGNMVSHGQEVTDAVYAYMRSETLLTELRTYVQTYRNLCREFSNESTVEVEHLLRALPFVAQLLDTGDRQILEDACLAFTGLIYKTDHNSIEAVQVVPRLTAQLVALLGHEVANVPEAALMALCNMLRGTNTQVERCFDAGCLDHIISFLQSREPYFAKLAAIATSNIFQQSPTQIQRALNNDILTPLRSMLADGETMCQKQAAQAIREFCRNSSAAQQKQLIRSGVLEPYCKLLPQADHELSKFVLYGIYKLQEDAGKNGDIESLCIYLENIGVLDQLKRLQEMDLDKELRFIAVLVTETLCRHGRDEIVVSVGQGYEYTLQTLAELVLQLKSQDLKTKMAAMNATLKLLRLQNPPRKALVEHGIVAPLIAALDTNCYNLQLLAFYALDLILQGTHRHRVAVVNSGAIPKLVALISDGGKMATLAAIVLGNIMHRATVSRDLVLSHGGVQALLPHMRMETDLELLRTCLITFCEWCSFPVVSKKLVELLRPALPHINVLLVHEDNVVLGFGCRAITSFLGSAEYIEAVQAVPGLTARVVRLLGHDATDVKKEALSAVANMLAGTETEASNCFDAGFLDYIGPLLQCNEPALVENAVSLTINIFRHTQCYMQRGLEKDILRILNLLLKILADAEPNSYNQYHAVTALVNIVISGPRKHKMAIVNSGAVPMLIDFLSHGEAVAESAARTLCHLILEEPEIYDLMLCHGAIQAVLPLMNQNTPMMLLGYCVLLYWNICDTIRTKSNMVMFELVLPALPFISSLLKLQDPGLLQAVCGSLTALMCGTHKRIELVQTMPGLTARLVTLLNHEADIVKRAASTVLCNMLTGTEIQINRCLDAGFLDHVVLLFWSSDSDLAGQAVGVVSKLLSRRHSLRQRLLEQGILTPILKILSYAKSKSSLQHHAIDAFIYVSQLGTREQRMAIVQSGAIPELVALLAHDDTKMQNVAIGILATIAQDGPGNAQLVLSHGALPALLPLLNRDTPLELLYNCVGAYRIFCSYGVSSEDKQCVSAALPQISDILEIENEKVVENTCSALVTVAKGTDGVETVQTVPELTRRLLALMGHQVTPVKTVAVTGAMIMLAGTDAQVERCLAANCVEHLLSFLQCKEPSLMQEAAEATRAALGAEHPRARRALHEDNLTPLMTILACPPKGQKTTVRGITNLWRRATAVQRNQLASSGVLEPYCGLLAQPGCAVTGEALDSIHKLIQVAETDGTMQPLCLKLKEIGVLDQISNLLEHDNEEVNEKARRILHTYFTKE